MKHFIYGILGKVSNLLLLFYKLRYPGLSFQNKGVFISGLKLNGSSRFINRKGKIAKTSFTIVGHNNTLIFDDDVKIYRCKFVIHGDNCTLEIRGPRTMTHSRFELLDNNTKLTIGNNTGFNHDRIVIAGQGNEVQIGRDCICAENVEIWASDTHSILDATSNQKLNSDQPVFIGNRVWLGNRSLIHKGVRIGDDAVVAAGSIVTKDVPPNTLVAGIPAKSIKNNIKWDVKRELENDSSNQLRRQ